MVGGKSSPQNSTPSGRLAGYLPKTWTTRSDHKTKNFGRYSKVFWRKFTKTSDIWSSLTKNYLKFHQIQWDLARSHCDLARSQWIRPNNITEDKTRNWLVQPETRRDPNRTIRLAFQVNFGFRFHPPESFESSSSQAQTWPGLIRGQPYYGPKINTHLECSISNLESTL